MTLDLPQPFGPTTAHKLLGKFTLVGSTKDLNPDSFIDLSRMISHFKFSNLAYRLQSELIIGNQFTLSKHDKKQ
jgi:hypothetical protein